MKTDWTNLFYRSTAAGVVIGLGATAYLCSPSYIIGTVLFTIGLFTVIYKKYELFTGQLFVERDFFKLMFILFGNTVGTMSMALLIRFTKIYTPEFANKVNLIVESKVNDNPVSLVFLSICCGMLMYLAITNYQKSKKSLSVILPIMAFIICGFEHSVANMYYFGFGGFNLDTVIIVVLGNYIGGNLLSLIDNEKI